MKITPSDYLVLKSAAQKVKENNLIQTPEYYVQNKIGKDHNKRFRWDLFYALAKQAELIQKDFLRNLYKYANDNHIETAMAKIVGEIY